MSDENMSPEMSSSENDPIVMKLNQTENENFNDSGNMIKFQLEDGFDQSNKNFGSLIEPSKRNIIPKKRSDYDDYLERSSSIRSRRKSRSIGKFYKNYIFLFLIFIFQ